MGNVGDKNLNPTNFEGEGDRNIDYSVRMKKFMDKYEETTGLRDCEENEINSENQGCKFDLATLGECAEYPYGYVGKNDSAESFAAPCIFLKFNKIFNWEPTPIDPKRLRCLRTTTWSGSTVLVGMLLTNRLPSLNTSLKTRESLSSTSPTEERIRSTTPPLL